MVLTIQTSMKGLWGPSQLTTLKTADAHEDAGELEGFEVFENEKV